MMTHSYKGWVIFYFRIYKKSIYIGGKNDEELEKEVFLISPGIPGNISVGGTVPDMIARIFKIFLLGGIQNEQGLTVLYSHR